MANSIAILDCTRSITTPPIGYYWIKIGWATCVRARCLLSTIISRESWKKILTPNQLDEISEKSEHIEHEQFCADGFDDAVKAVAAIESRSFRYHTVHGAVAAMGVKIDVDN
jgi:hypothetical protein